MKKNSVNKKMTLGEKRAYVAGLFDGEGCVNPTFRSKKYKEMQYHWPMVQLIISGQCDQLKDVNQLMGNIGTVYEQTHRKSNLKSTEGMVLFGNQGSLRATQPNNVLDIIHFIKPYVRHKKIELKYLEDAANWILNKRKTGRRLTKEDKTEFKEKFVIPSQKQSCVTGRKFGRKITSKQDF